VSLRAEHLDRHIELETATNFRDLGGYLGAGGRPVRWRTIFRADGITRLSDADIDVIGALGIQTVIDLRTEYEVSEGRFPVERLAVHFHHFPFLSELPDRQTFEMAPGMLASQYGDMVAGAVRHIIAALEVLAIPATHPAVFHCTAGKDRTGVLSAFVLSLLGVDDESVIAAYALSERAMTRLRASLIERYPDGRELIEQANEMFSARPETISALITTLEAEHGSLEGYLRANGAPADLADRLQSALLEPA
jgi:protein-tyrosine phosphatase